MATVAAIAIVVGQITKLTAIIQDGYGRPMLGSALTSPLSWSSNTPAVATVSPIVAYNSDMLSAIASGLTAGSATITATAPGGITATFSIVVQAVANPSVPASMVVEATGVATLFDDKVIYD